jgi:hypothetical protein
LEIKFKRQVEHFVEDIELEMFTLQINVLHRGSDRIAKTKKQKTRAPVAHTCNPSYSGGSDKENRSLVQSQTQQIICETPS